MLTTLTETINLTPDTLNARLATQEANRRFFLHSVAQGLDMTATPDEITGGWAVRSPEQPGYVEIVTEEGCTCQEYAVRKSCPHAELVRRIDEDTEMLSDLLTKALDFRERFDGDLSGYTLGSAIIALCEHATRRESLRNRIA